LLVEGAGDDVAYNGNGNGGVGVGGKVGVGEMILQQLLQKASLSRTSLSLSLSLSLSRTSREWPDESNGGWHFLYHYRALLLQIPLYVSHII
jgi:hypothetical protein